MLGKSATGYLNIGGCGWLGKAAPRKWSKDDCELIRRKEGKTFLTGNCLHKGQAGRYQRKHEGKKKASFRTSVSSRGKPGMRWGRSMKVSQTLLDSTGQCLESVLICRPTENNWDLCRVLSMSVGGVIGSDLHSEKITGFPVGMD